MKNGEVFLKNKTAKIKPSNKQRDDAITHLLGKTTVLEQMIEGLAKTFDEYMDWRGQKPAFLKHFNAMMKEAMDETQADEESDGETLEESTEDEGRRTEGVR